MHPDLWALDTRWHGHFTHSRSSTLQAMPLRRDVFISAYRSTIIRRWWRHAKKGAECLEHDNPCRRKKWIRIPLMNVAIVNHNGTAKLRR